MDTPGQRTALVERIDPGATCRCCGYRLDGLRPAGRCPECATIYPPYSGLMRGPPMSARAMCRLLAWPLIFFVLGFFVLLVVKLTGGGALTGVGYTFVGYGTIISLINGPVRFLALCSEHAQLGKRLGNPLAHLTLRERSAVLAALLAPLALAMLSTSLLRLL